METPGLAHTTNCRGFSFVFFFSFFSSICHPRRSNNNRRATTSTFLDRRTLIVAIRCPQRKCTISKSVESLDNAVRQSSRSNCQAVHRSDDYKAPLLADILTPQTAIANKEKKKQEKERRFLEQASTMLKKDVRNAL